MGRGGGGAATYASAMSSTPPDSTRRSRGDEGADLTPFVDLAARVTDALPASSPMAWRRLAFRAVLSAVVRDRVQNDTGDLEEGDESVLAGFVGDAAAAASVAPLEHRDDAFEIVLQGLLQDWVDNWGE